MKCLAVRQKVKTRLGYSVSDLKFLSKHHKVRFFTASKNKYDSKMFRTSKINTISKIMRILKMKMTS